MLKPIRQSVFAACFLMASGCLPGPTKAQVNGNRHFNEYVIEITARDEAGAALPGEMTAIVDATSELKETEHVLATSKDGIYYIVLPARLTSGDIQTLHLQILGRPLVDVDFQAAKKTAFSPPSVTITETNNPQLCDQQQVIPGGKLKTRPYVEYAANFLLSLMEDRAFASSYGYHCTVSYRDRDQIEVTFPAS